VRLHGPGSAWRVATSRNFGPYFAGNAFSASGTWFHNLAASILIYRLTHSPLLLGVLNFSQFIPVLVLAPWAGRFADTYDRRRLLLLTQPSAAVVSAGLAVVAWTGHATPLAIILFSLCLGSLNAFTNAAQLALVGSLVPRDDLPQAVALNALTFNLARAIGPASAAGVIAAFGTAPAFAVNAASYLAFTIGLYLVRPAAQARARRSSFADGLRVLQANPRLIGLLAVVVTVSFATDPINTEGPALAHEFGLSSTWAGAIVGVFGAGAVTAALLVGGLIASRSRTAITLTVMGIGITGLAVLPWFPAALLFAGVAGFGYLSSNTGATTQLQLGVDETQRGRIMALWSVAFLGIRPIASLLDGAIAATAGVRVATVVMATPAFLVAAGLSAVRVRSMRRRPAV
jgi:MFS family permease